MSDKTTLQNISASASVDAAVSFAFDIYGIDLALGAWAMDKASAGLTVEEIKHLLADAIGEDRP